MDPFFSKSLNRGLAVGVCCGVLAGAATAGQTTEAALRELGIAQVSRAKAGAYELMSVKLTSNSPHEVWKIAFKTTNPAMLASKKTDAVSLATNLGKTKLWTAGFCTEQMKSLIRNRQIELVFGALEDARGELQQGALCIAD